MVAFKSAFALSVLAAAQVAVAMTPACLLGAINTVEDPSDIKSICSGSKMQATIKNLCGNNAQIAMGVFSSNCAAYGISVSSVEPSSTAAATSTKTSASASKTSATNASETASKSGSVSDSASAASTTASASESTLLTVTTTLPASTMVYTTTGYNTDCSCTTTEAISTTIPAKTVIPTAEVTAPAGGAGTSGSEPSGSATTSGSIPISTGAASSVKVGSYAALFLGAGLAIAL